MKFPLCTLARRSATRERKSFGAIYLVREPRWFQQEEAYFSESSMRENRATSSFSRTIFSTVRNFHRRPMFSRIIGGRKSWREIETDREEKYRPLSSILLRTLDSGWWGKDACRTNWKLIAGINVALFTVGGAILHVDVTWFARVAILLVGDATLPRVGSCQAGHRY